MTIIEFMREALRTQHSEIGHALRDLTPEHLHWVPENSKVNSIGFTLWHYVRTEDNIVQFILQERKPTVWITGGYFERFGLDKVAQGTGMSTEDAHALRLPPMSDWMEYQQAVWQATDDYLASIDEASLDRKMTVRPFGEITALEALRRPCLAHGHGHFGEICVLRSLQGLPGGLV
ncbi:MAG: DinB family protein [Dehalococcoidia bacterium]